jgi:hypothetical protein
LNQIRRESFLTHGDIFSPAGYAAHGGAER